MTITVSAELEKRILEQVKTGHYPSAEAVISAAISKLLDESFDFGSGELDALIEEGLADVRLGNVVDGEQVFEEIAQTSAARRKAVGE